MIQKNSGYNFAGRSISNMFSGRFNELFSELFSQLFSELFSGRIFWRIFGRFFNLIIGLSLAACATVKPKAPPVQPAEAVTAPRAAHIDLDKLQESLGLRGDREDVGYNEKSFGTCEMGYGFNRNRDCRIQFLVVLRFRLQCRDHDGTGNEPVDPQSIHALDNVRVKWSLGKSQGLTQTDLDGYGQIRMLAGQSQKRERAKLTVDGRFLIMRAEDLSRIVAPADWCGKYR